MGRVLMRTNTTTMTTTPNNTNNVLWMIDHLMGRAAVAKIAVAEGAGTGRLAGLAAPVLLGLSISSALAVAWYALVSFRRGRHGPQRAVQQVDCQSERGLLRDPANDGQSTEIEGGIGSSDRGSGQVCSPGRSAMSGNSQC